MIVPLLYVIPALWLGGLVAFWMWAILDWGLADLPMAVLLGMQDAAWVVLLAGILLVVVGILATQWEVLYHKKAPYNVDALAIYLGAVLVVLAFVVSPQWWQWVGFLVTALCIGTHATIALLRMMMRWTRTLMTSMALLLGYFMVLGMATWVTFQVT